VVLGENPKASEHDEDCADESNRHADREHVQSQGQIHLQASSVELAGVYQTRPPTKVTNMVQRQTVPAATMGN
jgi:hypothetical protein